MTVAATADDGAIELAGSCPAEDAERLLRQLLERPGSTIDWRSCEEAHGAVVQVLLASAAQMRGPPRGAFLQSLRRTAAAASRSGFARGRIDLEMSRVWAVDGFGDTVLGAMTYKVLIVDDSKLARMAVNKALNALQPDWTRVEAANADEALEAVRSTDVDLAVLDFNMPGRDGLSLAEELHALRPDDADRHHLRQLPDRDRHPHPRASARRSCPNRSRRRRCRASWRTPGLAWGTRPSDRPAERPRDYPRRARDRCADRAGEHRGQPRRDQPARDGRRAGAALGAPYRPGQPSSGPSRSWSSARTTSWSPSTRCSKATSPAARC